MTQQDATKKMSSGALFTEYVNTCNTAIDRHRNEFPFKQLITMSDKLAKNKKFGVGMYASNHETPHDYFTVAVDHGRIQILEHGKENPDMVWKVKQSYLEKVVRDPQEYIEHPTKLDWDWLKSRLGVD